MFYYSSSVMTDIPNKQWGKKKKSTAKIVLGIIFNHTI